jgi:hypothetical protein
MIQLTLIVLTVFSLTIAGYYIYRCGYKAGVNVFLSEHFFKHNFEYDFEGNHNN